MASSYSWRAQLWKAASGCGCGFAANHPRRQLRKRAGCRAGRSRHTLASPDTTASISTTNNNPQSIMASPSFLPSKFPFKFFFWLTLIPYREFWGTWDILGKTIPVKLDDKV